MGGKMMSIKEEMAREAGRRHFTECGMRTSSMEEEWARYGWENPVPEKEQAKYRFLPSAAFDPDARQPTIDLHPWRWNEIRWDFPSWQQGVTEAFQSLNCGCMK
jgi:hypothetical protein